ncbi:hypothetical protein [Spiroplasma endosymbiont of Nebria brevicollis]|uniref:hypothetical protein n=1 Tax=Spiroplasma endosymbiont of Nebria brevicollis TaxID=3066284 RepID=UPI00313E374F
MLNLVKYLVNEWPIDINYKDVIGLSAWDYACFSLEKDIGLTIKKSNQTTKETRKFVQDYLVASSKEKFAAVEEKEIYEKYSQNRKYLLNYYQNKSNDIIEDFNSKKINSMDLQNQPSKNKLPSNIKI